MAWFEIEGHTVDPARTEGVLHGLQVHDHDARFGGVVGVYAQNIQDGGPLQGVECQGVTDAQVAMPRQGFADQDTVAPHQCGAQRLQIAL